jgi:hypothetical protein
VDMILNYMKNEGIPLTLSNYLGIAYMGHVKSLDDVGVEDRVEIEELLATGQLGVETADGKLEFRLPVDEEE